jgi:hypothetical protein
VSDELNEQAWLLKSKVNPFPVPAQMTLKDGRFTITLGTMAGDAVVGWIEEETGETNLAERLKGGEEVRILDRARDEIDVSWPKLYAGSALEVKEKANDRKWIISIDYPSGGSIAQTLSLFSGRKKGKAWKAALGG